jgi:hypothetical protein
MNTRQIRLRSQAGCVTFQRSKRVLGNRICAVYEYGVRSGERTADFAEPWSKTSELHPHLNFPHQTFDPTQQLRQDNRIYRIRGRHG